jgi:asparagine synthase (glutamine-hydrolysing)
VEQYTPDKALAWLERVSEACSEPLGDYSIFPSLLVCDLARRDVTVMLSGDGGDELFWGYVHRFGSVLRLSEAFRHSYALRSARHGLARLRGRNHRQNLRWPTIGDWYGAQHARLPEGALASLFDGLPPLPAAFDLFAYDGWQQDETARWLRWNEITGHLTRVLLKVDRASMYHSLEVRVPLLDREVVDVAARVEWRSCLDLRQNLGKIPLRRALARHLDYQSQAKRGFTVPMEAWLRGPLLPVFRDTVLGRPDVLGLPLNRPALEGMLSDHVAGRADHSLWLWSLLSLVLWGERHWRR